MLPTEIAEIWMQKQTSVTVMYYCIRYIGLLQFATTAIIDLSPGGPKVSETVLFIVG